MISPDSLCLIARGFGIMRYVNIIVDCLGSATNITTTGTSSSTRDTFHFIHIYSFCRKREWVEQEKKIKRFIWQQKKIFFWDQNSQSKHLNKKTIPRPNIWRQKRIAIRRRRTNFLVNGPVCFSDFFSPEIFEQKAEKQNQSKQTSNRSGKSFWFFLRKSFLKLSFLLLNPCVLSLLRLKLHG